MENHPLKIKLGQCRCNDIVYLVEEAGLRWTADMAPLDAQMATQALLAGRELYSVTRHEGRPHKLGVNVPPSMLHALRNADPINRPLIVSSHGCPPGAARELERHAPAPGGRPIPTEPSVGRTAPSSGPQTEPSSVPDAVKPRSKGPFDFKAMRLRTHPCSSCKKPIELDGPETYVAVELGAKVVWIQHDRCA